MGMQNLTPYDIQKNIIHAKSGASILSISFVRLGVDAQGFRVECGMVHIMH